MKQFQVNILGEDFEVRTDAREDEVLEIAGYVNEKMREAISNGRSTSREKAAVLAALNIAEEFFKQRKEARKTKEEVEERSNRLLGLIRREVDGLSGAG